MFFRPYRIALENAIPTRKQASGLPCKGTRKEDGLSFNTQDHNRLPFGKKVGDPLVRSY